MWHTSSAWKRNLDFTNILLFGSRFTVVLDVSKRCVVRTGALTYSVAVDMANNMPHRANFRRLVELRPNQRAPLHPKRFDCREGSLNV